MFCSFIESSAELCSVQSHKLTRIILCLRTFCDISRLFQSLVKMSYEILIKKKLPFKVKAINCVRLVLLCIVRFFCRLRYGSKGEKIPPITDDILKMPAIEVAKKIRDKEITSVEVLQICIKRIKDVNSELNFLVEDRFELAMKEAKEADDLIRSGTKTAEQLEKEKPFLGVPFSTKDCLAVKGLHHTSGVVLRKDVIADKDAAAIRLMRENGAIVVGLTNVPEICMWWESHNHIHGKTSNPYNTTKIVGGSSGGEGTIQAVAGTMFGIGSDIGGSIRMPSYFNGIFGHKPSKYIVSIEGQYPEPSTEMQHSFLGIGPMTRYAVDMKPILKIISGANASKLRLDDPVDITKVNFFYQFSNDVPLTDPVDPDIIAAMKKVVEYLKRQHKIIAEKKQLPLQKSLDTWMALMSSNKQFGSKIMENYSTGKCIKEIVKNAFGLSGNTMIALFTALIEEDVSEGKRKHYEDCHKAFVDMFSTMLGDNGVFLFPTHPTPAPYHHEPLARPFNFCYTALVNLLGMPSTAVPLGLSRDGLPIGIQVIANFNQDRLCLAVAEELDHAFGGWIEPQKS